MTVIVVVPAVARVKDGIKLRSERPTAVAFALAAAATAVPLRAAVDVTYDRIFEAESQMKVAFR